MLHIEVIAVGKFKRGGHFHDLWTHFEKQLQWPIKLIELDTSKKFEEHKLIQSKISKGAYIIALDERGQSLKSMTFAKEMEKLQDTGVPLVQFILGGADGLSDEIRNQANKIISFGSQTWPHMLARIMLIEQIYRSQQILKGHPYHRE
ncbi:MAG: 23S rRNA (pseudouridine(1915)-N(3))-methyltransferase RlmH [Pseudomonadota bacterium]